MLGEEKREEFGIVNAPSLLQEGDALGGPEKKCAKKEGEMPENANNVTFFKMLQFWGSGMTNN